MGALRILSPRLRLEPFGPEHLSEAYVGWLNNDFLMRFSEQRYHIHDLETCRSYASGFNHKESYLWAIVLAETKQHIGNINAYMNPRHQLCDLGILIGESDFQGMGIGTEAWQAAVHAMINYRNCRKVTGGCVASNMGMLKIMDQTGMVGDGRRARQYVYDGKAEDVIHMAIFADRYSEQAEIEVIAVPDPVWSQ